MNNDTQNDPKAKHAVVLGGRGLLGQALVAAMQASNWRVHSLEREHLRGIGQDASTLFDPEGLTRQINELEPDVIFNTMAWTQVDAAEEHPTEALAINRGLPVVLGRIAKNAGVQLVHYSTDFVFDGTKTAPYTENDVTNPQCVYGCSKLAGEQALLEMGIANCLILRTAWLFGAGRSNFVTKMLTLAQERPQLKVVHDQIGSPSYTPDVAQASMALVNCGASGVVHVVNSGQASWCELAAEAVQLANSHALVSAIGSDEWPTPAKRPAYSVLDTSLYTKLTGQTLRPWTQALRDFVYASFCKK